MAHLWKMNEPGEWIPVLLDGDVFAFGDARSPLALRRVEESAGPTWALVAPPDTRVLVNGTPFRLGLAVLADRDEIRVPGGPPLFFSTETLACVTAFPATPSQRGYCPRCKRQIEPESPAVRCPGCGLWHHETGEFPCWTYGPVCAACAQETALDAGFRWTPEEL